MAHAQAGRNDPFCYLLHARRNKRSIGRLCLTSQSRERRKLYETYRPDWSCAAGNDRIRFRQAGHSALARGGRQPDPGQGWPRAWSRTYGPRRTRSPLRVGQRPWSSLRMVQGPRSPPSPVSFRWIRLSPSHCPGDQANCSGANGSRPCGAAGSAVTEPQSALSRAPSPPRSGSGPNDSWRRASA